MGARIALGGWDFQTSSFSPMAAPAALLTALDTVFVVGRDQLNVDRQGGHGEVRLTLGLSAGQPRQSCRLDASRKTSRAVGPSATCDGPVEGDELDSIGPLAAADQVPQHAAVPRPGVQDA